MAAYFIKVHQIKQHFWRCHSFLMATTCETGQTVHGRHAIRSCTKIKQLPPGK